MKKRMVSKKELAELLGVKESAIDFMMEKRAIPYRVVGPRRALRFDYQEVWDSLPGQEPETKFHQLREEITTMKKLMIGYTQQLEKMEQALDALVDNPPPITRPIRSTPPVQDEMSEESSEEESSEEGFVEDVVERKEAVGKMFEEYKDGVGQHRGFPKF